MNNTTNNYVPNTAARIGGAILIGFTGMFALPILGVLGVSFTAVGIGLPILSVLNLIGFTHIPFNILFWHITGVPQVLVATVIGVVFLSLSWLCWQGLKKYFAFSRRLMHG